MHCCASSAAKEETLIPWTSDPSGRRQRQQKSEFRRTTDQPCHANTVQVGACSGKIGSGSIYRQLKRLQGRTLVWSFRSGWTVARIAFAPACRLSGPVGKSQVPDASASNAAQCPFCANCGRGGVAIYELAARQTAPPRPWGRKAARTVPG